MFRGRSPDWPSAGATSRALRTHALSPDSRMSRSLFVVLLAALSLTGGLGAQVADEALVPGGMFRAFVTNSFAKWDSRFGWWPVREELGSDLTATAAESLFTGVPSLLQSLQDMGATPGFGTTFGSTESRVSHDITRVDLGAHVGVFDWLTVGVVVPRVKNRTALDVVFVPDTITGELGLTPLSTNRSGVELFLSEVQTAAGSARSRASQLCGSGAPECSAATTLADRTESFAGAAQTAYGATPLFPIEGSVAAASVGQSASALEADLIAAGLSGFGAVLMPFATEWVTPDGFGALAAIRGAGIEGAPLEGGRSVWAWGDVEVSATAKLLEGRSGEEGASPDFSYRILGGVLLRLGTGSIDDPDVFLDLASGDGQTDVEGRLSADLILWRRWGVRAAGRYGVQGARTLTRRVAPPETVLAPLSSRQAVRWTPGSYWGLEIAPGRKLTDVLSFSGEYRVFRKHTDTFELIAAAAAPGLDPTVLSVESSMALHEVGIRLTYDTLSSWRTGAAPRLFQVQFRALWSVAGSGGQTPAASRVEIGLRLFRGLWGSR